MCGVVFRSKMHQRVGRRRTLVFSGGAPFTGHSCSMSNNIQYHKVTKVSKYFSTKDYKKAKQAAKIMLKNGYKLTNTFLHLHLTLWRFVSLPSVVESTEPELINPCYAGNHDCDTTAQCIPLEGQDFQCQCATGYRGDGRNCYGTESCRIILDIWYLALF